MRDLNDAAMRGFGGAAAVKGRMPAHTMGALRRYTLILLRWGAITGQALALLIVSQVLEFDYPVVACTIVIASSILVNLIITAVLPLDRRVGDREAALQLGFDLIQLSALLYLTGGMTNPFAILFLAPVVTSATTLSKSVLFSLAGLAVILSFGLLYYFQPLPWTTPGGFDLPFVFRFGFWTAIVVGSLFTSLYAWRATKESRKMSAALAATEAMLAQEQKLSALGGLAAAAAHELGTPLATIQLTAKEMMRDLDKGSDLREDAELILGQALRCRDILEQLSLRGDEGDMIHDQMTVEDLLEEVAEPFIGRDKDLTIQAEGDGLDPALRRQPELLYALKNYAENAVDFAQRHVVMEGDWTQDAVTICIEDDGPGFDPNLMGRLGQPYVSTRRRAQRAGGLGLGLFISATLIERTGGKVFYESSDLGGARIRAVWPRSALVD